MSLCTTIRFVPMSHSKSQEPAASKIGLVTPAMYPGLRRFKNYRSDEDAGGRVQTYMFSHSSRLVRVAYGNARLMNPLRTTPHPEPKEQAART